MNSLVRSLVEEFFDADFYRSTNPDVASAGVDPVEHYLTTGVREGRTPAPWFDPVAYRKEVGLGPGEDAFLHLVTTDLPRANALKASSQKTASAAARKVKPLMQPFYALAPQSAGTSTTIFTAIAGTRHALANNATDWPDMRVYGDTPVALSGWRFHPGLYWDQNPKLIALFHKYCLSSFFPDGTKLIWTDSRVSVQHSIIHEIGDVLDRADLCVFKHYERDCVYEELMAIIKGGRAPFEEVEEFERHLRARDFPDHGGLFETGLLGIKTGPETSRVLRRVFGLARRYVARDQVTLPLALVGSDLTVEVFRDGTSNLRNTSGVFVHPW